MQTNSESRLGIGSYAYAWAIGLPGYPPAQPMDVFSFVERAAALGVGRVQIADNLPLHRLDERRLADLVAVVRQRGIAVEVGTRGIGPDHLRMYLALAGRFESPILRVVVDTADHHPAPDEIVSILRGVLPEFEAAGITLAIENHDRFKARTLAQIIQRLDSPRVGICLDTVNSFGSAEGPETVVAALAPYVVNLHVKDFSIRRHDHTLGFILEGTPAGKGMLDMPWLLAQLTAHQRIFSLIVETWPSPEATLEATIEKEDRWVAESVAYLRTLLPG
jgi:sugar phosphate isomerase/epimerase